MTRWKLVGNELAVYCSSTWVGSTRCSYGMLMLQLSLLICLFESYSSRQKNHCFATCKLYEMRCINTRSTQPFLSLFSGLQLQENNICRSWPLYKLAEEGWKRLKNGFSTRLLLMYLPLLLVLLILQSCVYCNVITTAEKELLFSPSFSSQKTYFPLLLKST